MGPSSIGIGQVRSGFYGLLVRILDASVKCPPFVSQVSSGLGVAGVFPAGFWFVQCVLVDRLDWLTDGCLIGHFP